MQSDSDSDVHSEVSEEEEQSEQESEEENPEEDGNVQEVTGMVGVALLDPGLQLKASHSTRPSAPAPRILL